MRHQAIKVRIYPTNEQKIILAQHFDCSRWWWNYALSHCIDTYQATGKGVTQSSLNAMLPKLKKAEETKWLKDCYSQVFQATTLNLVTAYKNFFNGRARLPRFKSKKNKQSIQFPQNVKIDGGNVRTVVLNMIEMRTQLRILEQKVLGYCNPLGRGILPAEGM